jgi:hypothetical protein
MLLKFYGTDLLAPSSYSSAQTHKFSPVMLFQN